MLALVLGLQAFTSGGQPAEGILVEGKHSLEVASDRSRISLLIRGLGPSAQAATTSLAAANAAVAGLLAESAVANDSLFDAASAPIPSQDTRSNATTWSLIRELRFTLPAANTAALIAKLEQLEAVSITAVEIDFSDRVNLERKAIEAATADAARKATVAARQLGFALGAVREVRVLPKELRGPASLRIDVTIDVRYALVPATTRSEILAIAGARPSSTPARQAAPQDQQAAQQTRQTASPDDDSSAALTVEVIAATYDASGRGRFTTSTGTSWRETVPTPAEQRLKNGRKYTGTITLGVFGGYRMQLNGVPRILKVEPVERPASSVAPRSDP